MAEITDYLQCLEEQNVQEEKQIVVVENPVVEKICDLYEDWLVNFKKGRESYTLSDSKYVYDSLLDQVKDFECSAKVISDFSFSLKKYEKIIWFDVSGIFLSALINNSPETDFEIMLTHLCVPLNFLGMRNTKNLRMLGNVNMCSGYHQEKSGIITIIGDTGRFTGWKMNGGQITVNGNAGVSIGVESGGGEIYVNGSMGSIISDNCKAKIYHKGELVWPR